MDKKTLLAVVLSVVVITVGFVLQGVIWPREPVPETPAVSDTGEPGAASEATGDGATDAAEGDAGQASDAREDTTARGTTPGLASGSATKVVPAPLEDDVDERTITIDTNIFRAVFTNRGGELQSLELKSHLDEGEPIDMIYNEGTGVDAFFLSFGVPGSEPVDALFDYSRRGEYGIEFERDFLAPAGPDGRSHPFTLKKRYTFEPETYMFELIVTIENSVNEFPNLDFNGDAYTLGFGPQIGPEFESLGGRGEYRQYVTFVDGKRKFNSMPRGEEELEIEERFIWGGIVGKYFALLTYPLGTYDLTFAQPYSDEIPSTSYLYLSRPLIKGSVTEDRFLIYAGPKTPNQLETFNNAGENPFGVSNLNMDEAVDRSALLGWLESVLKFLLDLFYRLIPNYGVAIIILSIFIKVVFYPITRKSFDSTAKMQQLQPKIEELKKKYPGKEKAQQLNQEMAALYKREKVNPLGGCLPLLIQMPIFIAFYGVLTKHFALRGAEFFGWITDLSEPDSLVSFGSFTLPILGWNDLRILPIIYIGTQLLTSKFMQAPNTSSSKNMKMMQYFLPIMFFFILYNAPSGLLIYWTCTNILTVIQQRATIAYRETHEPEDKSGGGGGNKGPGKGPGKGPNRGPNSGPKKGPKKR